MQAFISLPTLEIGTTVSCGKIRALQGISQTHSSELILSAPVPYMHPTTNILLFSRFEREKAHKETQKQSKGAPVKTNGGKRDINVINLRSFEIYGYNFVLG